MATITWYEKVMKGGRVSLTNPTSRNMIYSAEVYLLTNPGAVKKSLTSGQASMSSILCSAGATVLIPALSAAPFVVPDAGQSDVTHDAYVAVMASVSGGTPVALTPAIDSGTQVVITVLPAANFNSITWS